MVRALLISLLAVRTAAADPPNRISIDAAEEIGILASTHTTVTAGYMRRLWSDRVYVDARLGVGRGADLWWLEERVGVGLVFRRDEPVELRIGWRLGDSYLRGEINTAAYSIHLLAIELAVQIAIRITPAWRLRAVPLATTLFWNKTYGGSVGLEIGLEHAF